MKKPSMRRLLDRALMKTRDASRARPATIVSVPSARAAGSDSRSSTSDPRTLMLKPTRIAAANISAKPNCALRSPARCPVEGLSSSDTRMIVLAGRDEPVAVRTLPVRVLVHELSSNHGALRRWTGSLGAMVTHGNRALRRGDVDVSGTTERCRAARALGLRRCGGN